MVSRWRARRNAPFAWHSDIATHFPECDQVMKRVLVTNQKRSRFLGRSSAIWFRLVGGIEIILGVTLPLLFVYDQTSTNTGLLATVSVVVAVSAALKSFFGWQNSWGTYRSQSILLASILGEWELELIGLIYGDSANKQLDALDKTREAVKQIFSTLNQEHEAFFSAIQSPEKVVEAIRRSKQNPGQAALP
ncbi:DUF4231 domain-containing protein [Streptomyces sp. NPDC058947]|uniref:DUF4231 domain-containing protein n=1 Tax=Streptomyces sp. NPDC058947 TaxID=3346675 RepID=UPI0036755B05